ncbi:MAG: Alkyl hydroperoxide reductase AhpD [Gammaproteobacteria bacterium]|nr:Alkyl hydroperoxide reductase AhpD [Gammaproteobacteria bacterium]
MSQPKYLHALDLPVKDKSELDPDIQEAFNFLEQEHGLLPNVLKSYTFDQNKLRPFMQMYNDLMLADSPLSMLEREMIGVVVSATNRCLYCLVAHGAAVRQLSGDPLLGELLVMNYRTAELPVRQRAMLDFAIKVTEASHQISEADREGLRQHGFSDRAIWDISAVAAFFNMTNRMASAIDMMPNEEYHYRARTQEPS